jgi:hypothetical protein
LSARGSERNDERDRDDLDPLFVVEADAWRWRCPIRRGVREKLAIGLPLFTLFTIKQFFDQRVTLRLAGFDAVADRLQSRFEVGLSAALASCNCFFFAFFSRLARASC